MFCYPFNKYTNILQLQSELLDNDLNVSHIDLVGSVTKVHFTVEPTSSELDTLSLLVQNHVPRAIIPDVTPRQIRQALILSGVSLQDIDTALDSLPEPTKSLAKVEWEYSVAFQRYRPLVQQVGTMLGWTSQQLDDLWILAGTL